MKFTAIPKRPPVSVKGKVVERTEKPTPYDHVLVLLLRGTLK